MFTGIVEELGRVIAIDPDRLTLSGDVVLEDAATGDSIAVNGACLTLVEQGDGWWVADVSEETWSRTNLRDLAVDDPVNLERPVRVEDRLGGHVVQGHVDAVGEVVEPAPDLRVRMPVELMRYCVEKGSITVDGVSLTAFGLDDDTFRVAVIPHTAAVTTLGYKGPGASVNIEVDVIAKHLERLAQPYFAGMTDTTSAAERDVDAPMVCVRHVSKTFSRRGASTQALRDVSLTVAPGEFVSLLGPSGCGKSTLLRIIGGLMEADRGEVEIAGDEPHHARDRKQFGLVPQTPALLPWRTVRDNVHLLHQLNRKRQGHESLSDERIDELLETVGLARFLDAYPRELSGGLQQRASLVRAFALGAPILLMDEPFAALDEITRADMRYLLLDLWERSRTTVIFVTHSIPEAVILSDRVVVLAARPGRIATDEPIALVRPRREAMEDSPAFHQHLARLRHALREGHAA